MSDDINGDKVLGDKVDTKIVNHYEMNHIDLDIGILKDILQTNPILIKESLSKLNTSAKEFTPDENFIPITEKNIKNGLEDFYEDFIRHTWQKLDALHLFFQEEDYIDDIEEAADSIKMFIFTYQNRNSHILEQEIFYKIIKEHTISVEGRQEKEIMKLVIYYLYRYCYIGAKDA